MLINNQVIGLEDKNFLQWFYNIESDIDNHSQQKERYLIDNLEREERKFVTQNL